MKQTITVTGEVDIPEGYECTGEYRVPNEGESFIDSSGGILTRTQVLWAQSRIILRKTERWRPATKADIIRVLSVQMVKARFRDYLDYDWVQGILAGGVPGSNYPWGCRIERTDGGYTYEHYRHCEVLDV